MKDEIPQNVDMHTIVVGSSISFKCRTLERNVTTSPNLVWSMGGESGHDGQLQNLSSTTGVQLK